MNWPLTSWYSLVLVPLSHTVLGMRICVCVCVIRACVCVCMCRGGGEGGVLTSSGSRMSNLVSTFTYVCVSGNWTEEDEVTSMVGNLAIAYL